MHARRPWPERLFRRVKAFRLRWEHLHHVSLATVALIAVAVFFVLGVVLRLAMGPVWRETDVKAFLAVPRKAGRRPKTAPKENRGE